jgi:hypothetical protein
MPKAVRTNVRTRDLSRAILPGSPLKAFIRVRKLIFENKPFLQIYKLILRNDLYKKSLIGKYLNLWIYINKKISTIHDNILSLAKIFL